MEELDYMANAVATARRGWATASLVENTKPLHELMSLRPKRR